MPSKTAIEIPPSMWKQYHPFSISSKRQVVSSADIAEARRVAATIAHELVSRFGAIRVFLFGSLTREDFNKRSDIDLLSKASHLPIFTGRLPSQAASARSGR